MIHTQRHIRCAQHTHSKGHAHQWFSNRKCWAKAKAIRKREKSWIDKTTKDTLVVYWTDSRAFGIVTEKHYQQKQLFHISANFKRLSLLDAISKIMYISFHCILISKTWKIRSASNGYRKEERLNSNTFILITQIAGGNGDIHDQKILK